MKRNRNGSIRSILLQLLVSLTFLSCASRGAIPAEEFFAIGMAYYDLGNYAEAERWLIRARQSDRTIVASDYNLGRIAFETGRFTEAARYFEGILTRDSSNIMALRAAAYSRIRSGDFAEAETHYSRVLALVPESADDGYNHALVLYGMNRFAESEAVLNRYPHSLNENSASVLLLARAQKAQEKVEAVDSYAKWLSMTSEPGVEEICEYAQALEAGGFFARALEQYQAAVNALAEDADNEKRASIRYDLARLFLTADSANAQGMRELETAITEGFSDISALEILQRDLRVRSENRDEIRRIIDQLQSRR